MRTARFLRFALLPVMAISFVLISCDKDDDDDMNNQSNYTISGNASGAQEVPAVTTTGAATLTGTYNADSNMLRYTINWTGLSGDISVAHFHGPALAGVSAGPIHDIEVDANGTAGSTTGSVVVADSTEAHLLAGRIYYNLHTVLNPGGEIRGQVTTTKL